MKNKKKQTDQLPDDFETYDSAAAFWDTHDTTDYLAQSRVVKTSGELRARHYEIEIDIQVAETLRAQAKQRGIKPGQLANDLLRQQLANVASRARSSGARQGR